MSTPARAAMLACVLAVNAAGSAAPRPIPAPVAPKTDTLVGVYYFPGWSQADRWYCMNANPKVLHPLLGYYREGEPEVADWHIKWAVEHGVGFFAYDFYTHHGSQMLEAALDRGFLKSRFADRMKFCINWCNHAPAETMTAEHLAEFAELVVPKYLTHPSCLRIGGKPVLMILSGYSFVKTLGVEGARKAFADLDERCKREGLPGVHLVFCEGEIVGEQALRDCLAAGAHAFSLYNYPYAGTGMNGPGKYGEATYKHMIDEGEKLWKHWSGLTDKRFWPTVMPGWDRRPWLKDADLLRTGSTPALFRDSLIRAKRLVNADNIVMVEAWNEWGEGCSLEPTIEQRFAYLDQVRSVFCPGAGAHRDITPRDLGRPNPEFELRLPHIDAWRFDFDEQGWKGTGIADVKTDHGALMLRSTTNDPQITSPRTYLDCGVYGGVRIRMRCTPPEGGPRSATGQLFWSTVEHAMSEKTSATFPVVLDGAWHDVVIDLAAAPMWNGTADVLRLDLVDIPGVSVAVDEVCVLKRGSER